MTKLLLAAAVLPLLAACATAAEIAPPQKAALEATCSRVMGLRAGEAEFAGCVDTLSDALAQQTAYDRTASAYRACAQQGVARGTPDYGRCVLDNESNATPQGAAALDASQITTPANFSGGYFSASFPMRYRRAEYACATIGLQPASGSFQSCANDLDSNMWLIEHPPG